MVRPWFQFAGLGCVRKHALSGGSGGMPPPPPPENFCYFPHPYIDSGAFSTKIIQIQCKHSINTKVMKMFQKVSFFHH